MSLLKVNQLTVMRGEDVALVDNVSLTLEAGEMLGLVGESGSGKTVTCRALMRLLPGPDCGLPAVRFCWTAGISCPSAKGKCRRCAAGKSA